MRDTTPEMEEKMRELIRNKSSVERARMGASMYSTSRQLVLAAILRENPEISPIAIKQELFLKFYGNDFAPAERNAILEHLARVPLTD
jgi:hypothetical protein